MFLEDKRRGEGGGGLRQYILIGHQPVRCDDAYAWAVWFQTANRRVAFTPVHYVHVSTVFLGLDHQFGVGPPLLFETMIFGGGENSWMARCSTWNEAEQQHRLGMLVARAARRKPTALQFRRESARRLRKLRNV